MAKDLARKLRRQATYPEQDFWRLTWSLRQAGWPFRRQQLIGSYYVDFACINARLVVEVDGDTHGGMLAQSNDAVRDDYLAGRGFTVLRFSNHDLTTNAEGVFQVVSSYLDTLPLSPPTPTLPLAGRAGVGGATNSISSRGDQK